MFVSRERAATIDASDGRLCADVAALIPGGAVTPIGGGLAVFARPGSPVNKVVGLGYGAPLEEQALAELEARGPVRVELSTLADPAVGRLLSARGYRLEGFENVLGLALPAPARPAAKLEVVRTDDLATWSALMIDGFCVADETSEHAETYPRPVIEEVMGDMLRAPGYDHYLAIVEREPAGAAGMRRDGDLLLMTGAATLPQFRRRGVQGALLARRLADAGAAGCALAVITTAPGTRSQENAQRQGFALLYARAVLTKGEVS